MQFELKGMKIAEYLIKEKGYKPLNVVGFETKGMFLENTLSGKYPIIFISMKQTTPDNQMSKKVAEEITSQLRSQAMMFSAKLGIISFGDTIVKVEYKESDVFVCDGEDIHSDLYKEFPGMKSVIKSKNEMFEPEPTKEQVMNRVKAAVIKDAAVKTAQISDVITSGTEFSFRLMMILMVIPYFIFTILIYSGVITETSVESLSQIDIYLIQGASFGPLTFDQLQLWRLFSGFFVNDLITIVVVFFLMRRSMVVVEGIYGKVRTIAIFMLTGIVVTFVGTVVNSNSPTFGSWPVFFSFLGALIYYSYYNRILYKKYLAPVIWNFVILALIVALFNERLLIDIVVAIVVGYLFAAILGFKHSKGSREMIFPILALMLFIGGMIALQLIQNRAYTDFPRAYAEIDKIMDKVIFWK